MNTRPRVLVCDQDTQTVRALRAILREAGFEMDAAETAREALDRAALRTPAAAILELQLPDGDGVELCCRLRDWSEMPVMIISSASTVDEKVRALESGADDYVTKPFAPRELVARLGAIRRRANGEEDHARFELNGLDIDLAARIVRRDGREVHLTPTEFRLLRTLIAQRGRLLTHTALLKHVWGVGYAQDTQVLRTHIANLRRKLELPDGLRLIQTDHGVGYRFGDCGRDYLAHQPQARAPEMSHAPEGRSDASSRRTLELLKAPE